MDLDSPELPRERAVSSEPCTTRPKPFDETESSSRKRQRVSNSGSRSRSVDAGKPPTATPGAIASDTVLMGNETESPSTPDNKTSANSITEPTSSKVTINLRKMAMPDTDSESALSPESPSNTTSSNHDHNRQMSKYSTEVEGVASAKMALKSAFSSPSAGESPRIEVITVNDDDDDADFQSRTSPVAIIDDDFVMDADPMDLFPFRADEETLVSTVRRIARFWEFENVDDESSFEKLRQWMLAFLRYTAGREDSWHGNYMAYRDFWDLLPEIIWALNRRRNFFGNFLNRDDRSGRESLSRFFHQYALLTARFVIMDLRTLAAYDDVEQQLTEPILASRPHLCAFSWLLRKDETPHIGRNLEVHYRWNWGEDVSILTANLFRGGAGIPALTTLVKKQLALLPRFPKLIENLTEPCRITVRTAVDAALVVNESESTNQRYMETYQAIITSACKFFQVMSAGLVTIIEKHVTILSPDAALVHINGLTTLLFYATLHEPFPVLDLIHDLRQKFRQLPSTYTSSVISTEWKFEMLKRLIISGQMQLRVIGVTTMCSDLLSMYTKYKKEEPSSNALLQHFATFILRNQLVNYIVGTGSHPEIISESGNIVGFLIATKGYTDSQTDTIWHTVMTSQDPRVVEAILRMLTQILSLYDRDSLLYLCHKVEELPIESFTGPMRDYCERLLSNFIQKAISDKIQCIESPPYDLCVRLIRESSVARAEAPLGFLDVQQFASARLHDLTLHGPEAEVRNRIYVSCIKDISERKPTAPGSICVLLALLRPNITTDLRVLTMEHDLTRLMIEELEYTSAIERGSSTELVADSPARQACRDLLLSIIIYEPATISEELGKRLWDVLVGREARSPSDREIAWQILNSAAKKCSSKSVFITTCFQTYLPALEPQYYTIGALDFAREAIVAWLREADGDLLDEEEHEDSHSVEQLWRMILAAPPNSIEGPAINMLVELYVESPVILTMPRARTHSVHLALVDRCLAQLSIAAKKLKGFADETITSKEDVMLTVASDQEIHEQELIFTRSLLLLREFLRIYQSKPYFATPKPTYMAPKISTEVKGDPIQIQYQIFDGAKSHEVNALQLGSLNTVAALFTVMRKITSFETFKMYHWGKEIEPTETDLSIQLRDLKFDKGLVLIQRRDDIDLEKQSRSRLSGLELEIVRHFDELWDCLGMEERLAQEESIDSLNLSRSVGLIVSAIVNPNVLNGCANEDLRYVLAQHLVDCLTQLLKEPLPAEPLAAYLNDTLLRSLLELLHAAKVAIPGQHSVQLIFSALEAILEVSQHSVAFWKAFKTSPDTSNLLREFLLEDARPVVRKGTMKQLAHRCSYTPSISNVSSVEFANFFWLSLAELIPLATKLPGRCEETLSLALHVFRKLANTFAEQVDLTHYLLQWGSLLAEHKSQEEAGDPENFDIVTRGLANLLYWCVSFVKASEQKIPSNSLAFDLFRRHLFPEVVDSESDELNVECIPLLNTVTRKVISDIIVSLTKDDIKQYRLLVDSLTELLPFEKDDTDPYAMELSFNFDRSKAIRSRTGYVGLRNLSNTCYLNSLFTQLFMNVSFRKFMLDAYIADGNAAQKLLFETQKLFAFMQNSLRRFVDPIDLAGSIRTYDDTAIDVSVQMDVDEFYNLLFDRWESQILATGHKKVFRSFYGGQLVQQVKSKECAHISERLEPFSAIQCDIKGKVSLQESLQAYVDGEVMEGDNKYKCSTCDRHVNAVKRACLKDIPDNLIFHLKRFDFNLRTMQRSKINDYFSFPHKIDMRPYKVEHLMEHPNEVDEDVFELVGILVHSGTAESGHYYSYIRERPSKANIWVEYNDDIVSPFDPSCIEANCFGGLDYRAPENGSFQFDKSWSAYMLFYQRSSSLQVQQQELLSRNEVSPVRLSINSLLSNFITSENEWLMRKYCLYDEAHAPFVLRMSDNVRHINQGHCSDDHELERSALSMTLQHFDQVITRTKDLPELENYVLALNHRFQSCAECCGDFLEWLIGHSEAFRQLLFKNPDPTVRNEIGSAVIRALKKLKQDASYAYGVLFEAYTDEDSGEDVPPRLFEKILEMLDRFWESFHLSTRAWPEYFSLLANMARLGTPETALLLDRGFLRRAMDVIRADSNLPMNPQYTRMLTILSKRPLTKPVSFACVIELLETLLKTCDLNDEIIDADECRHEIFLNHERMQVTTYEHQLMTEVWHKGNINILVEKLLRHNQNERATQSIIALLLSGPKPTHPSIANAIQSGIRRATTPTSSTPFLRAAFTFCANTNNFTDIASMVSYIANVTRGMESADGAEHLRFFKDVHGLFVSDTGTSQDQCYRFVLDQIPIWSPSLLSYYDPVVRADTEDYVHQTILSHCADLGPNASPNEKQNAQALIQVARKLGVECLQYLNEEHVRPRVNAVKANLLSIQAIIHLCKPFYDEISEDQLDVAFVDLHSAVIPSLKRLTVEEIDDDVSEWENSDDAFSSSGGDFVAAPDLPF
ncbi:MAG: Ubiquitin carboxyl-terminal hydrolase 34 [Claussenomyces sp. TS43310]|nr:MAG: Ubiquitin carboxyl-terminal hydrolase 34 [Claussenomyces sp. TS43310]